MYLKWNNLQKKSLPAKEEILIIKIKEFIRLIQRILENPGFSISLHRVNH